MIVVYEIKRKVYGCTREDFLDEQRKGGRERDVSAVAGGVSEGGRCETACFSVLRVCVSGLDGS